MHSLTHYPSPNEHEISQYDQEKFDPIRKTVDRLP